MNCPNCGKEITGNKKFCKNCGYDISTVSFRKMIFIASLIMPLIFTAIICSPISYNMAILITHIAIFIFTIIDFGCMLIFTNKTKTKNILLLFGLNFAVSLILLSQLLWIHDDICIIHNYIRYYYAYYIPFYYKITEFCISFIFFILGTVIAIKYFKDKNFSMIKQEYNGILDRLIGIYLFCSFYGLIVPIYLLCFHTGEMHTDELWQLGLMIRSNLIRFVPPLAFIGTCFILNYKNNLRIKNGLIYLIYGIQLLFILYIGYNIYNLLSKYYLS